MLASMRWLIQQISFLVLTYGGRLGIHFGYSLPCLSCPFIPGCGGSCFLMALQGVGPWGVGFFSQFSTYQGMQLLSCGFFFVLLVILLSKMWCGWICPFGTLQDWLSILRRHLGIREAEFSWKTRERLKPIKYVLLVLLVLVPPLIAFAGLSQDFNLFFCQLCPARLLMPLFAGRVRDFALDYTNTVLLVLSVLSLVIAAVTVIGSFFKDRFFCIFCPMLPLMQLFEHISLVRLVKKGDHCTGCGNCQRLCPMDVRKVHLETGDKPVVDEDCLLCMRCAEACPEDKALQLRFWHWKIFASARLYAAKKLRKGISWHE